MREIEARLVKKLKETKFYHEKVAKNVDFPLKDDENIDDFQVKCPPGGSESVILYTTSLRAIRKTFEDCNQTRFVLESFGIRFQERDVSMDLEYREELWRVLEGRVVPPRLFVKGRYVGGGEEVVGLHEQGKLRKLFCGMPFEKSNRRCEDGCGGLRFVMCLDCNGSRKVFRDESMVRCFECNENGLIRCPVCC